jgi:N-acetylneuraminic acid mutarotase
VIGGKLYVAGGAPGGDALQTTNILEVYDPAMDTWTTKASMPSPVLSAAAGVVDGRLYVAGGMNYCGACTPLNTLEVYDPVTDSWTTKAPMPSARSQLDGESAVVNGLFYVVGGSATATGNPATGTLQVYNPATDTWTIKTSMPTPRDAPGVGVLGGILYAAGGRDGAGNSLATVETYNPSTDNWTELPALPTARSAASTLGSNGVLYVAGGAAPAGLNIVEAFTSAPVAAVSGPGDGVPGQPRTFNFSANSVSPIDQAAGFAYAITWGDGSPIQTVARTDSNGSGVSLDHTYTATGSYTVQVTATDKDNGTSPTASQSITLLTAEMQGTDLAVGGTTGNDTILLSPADTAGHIAVSINGVAEGSFLPTGHILVYGQSGNDTILLLPKFINGQYVQIGVPAVLFAGNGNDILSAAGSSANNVLVGASGNNLLTGGTGRNILIAGSGTSTLVGGTGQDILIGGSTDFDHNLTALYALTAEWGRTDASYATRVSHLNGSLAGGLNGSFFLNATTVHGNANADNLIGGLGPDWFFAAANDQLLFVFPGEIITKI